MTIIHMKIITTRQSGKKLKNELAVNEAIVKQNNQINLEIENLRERGKSFLLNHRNEKNCPLCNTSFQSWEMLFEQVQRIELLGEKEIQAKQEIICKMKNLDMEYEKFYTIWRTKKGNKLKELDDIILHYKPKFPKWLYRELYVTPRKTA